VTIDGAIAGWFPGEGVRVMETRAPRIDRQFDLNELEINVSEGNRVRGGIQVNDLCNQRLAETPCFGTLDATFECELEVEFIFPNEEDIQ
jgi:hypothetical protein